MNELPRLIWLPALLVCTVALGLCSQQLAPTHATGPDQTKPSGPDLARPRPGESSPGAARQYPASTQAAQVDRPAQSPSGADRPRAIEQALQADITARVSKALGRVSKESGGAAQDADCRVCFRMIDLESGRVIAERDALRPSESASNMKLVTTLAALVALGPGFRFETVAEANGPTQAGVLRGDLILRAAGDPFYSAQGADAAKAELGKLARSVADEGIRTIQGDLIFDAGGFVESGPAPGWPKPEGFWTASYGLSSAFTLQGGLVTMTCTPQGLGELCRVELAPWPCGLDLEASVAGIKGRGNDVRLGLVDVRRELGVSGTYGASNGSFSKAFRHPAPKEMFAAAFQDELYKAGIKVQGKQRHASGTPVGRQVAVLSRSWLGLIEPINTDSVNSVADGLLVAMGHERFGIGSREQGARAVLDVLRELKVDVAGFHQADGSGLSRDNRVHAELLSELLVYALELPEQIAQVFLDSLALAGETGTLERRMLDGVARGRVRAKTGWIKGASSLSGVAETLRGRRIAFSMLVNYPRVNGLNNSVWKPMLDDICERLVQDGVRSESDRTVR